MAPTPNEIAYVEKLLGSFRKERAARERPALTARPTAPLRDVSLTGDALALVRISLGLPDPRPFWENARAKKSPANGEFQERFSGRDQENTTSAATLAPILGE